MSRAELAVFKRATWPMLVEWIHGVEGWSTAQRRIVWAWKRAHGFKRVRRLEGGINQRVWKHPTKRLLPKHLGGQVVVIDKES